MKERERERERKRERKRGRARKINKSKLDVGVTHPSLSLSLSLPLPIQAFSTFCFRCNLYASKGSVHVGAQKLKRPGACSPLIHRGVSEYHWSIGDCNDDGRPWPWRAGDRHVHGARGDNVAGSRRESIGIDTPIVPPDSYVRISASVYICVCVRVYAYVCVCVCVCVREV